MSLLFNPIEDCFDEVGLTPAQADSTYLRQDQNLADLDDAGTARANLGLVAGGAGDIWVEKTGDTMTGQLFIDGTADTNQLKIQNANTQNQSPFRIENPAANLVADINSNGRYRQIASNSSGVVFTDSSGTATNHLLMIHTGAAGTIANATGALSIEGVSGNEIVVNNAGGTVNFRVEGDGEANLITTNAAQDTVGIGVTGQTGRKLSVSATNGTAVNNYDAVNVSMTQNQPVVGTGRGMNVTAIASHTSGTLTGLNALDFTANISGNGGVTSTAQGVSAFITVASGASVNNARTMNIAAPSVSGTINQNVGLNIGNITGGTSNYAILSSGGSVVFNENGTDSDTRMEGDNEANLFFLDASTDRIGLGVSTPGERLDVRGNFALGAVGNKLLIKEGSNASMGTVALSGGSATVNNTLVTASSRIFLTGQDGTANVGSLWVSARTAGTSFAITSTNVLSNQTVAWHIIEPAA